MNGASRLLSVRLQGFKSFAERTHVEFGPGISAVVGPNGSGKSNLADALRWALGEQGRALRSRKAEDVIWAGSEGRAALGMADVQLVVDNADGLLPIEYGVVELGRRLYRSGENDYLLNRQRIRLRDLVDLLDAAHLADNAFLFIGQGMVDQALALRPEERRPLFEEVAGVRRHERRRRRAEEQLAESEANLARVEDILGELRPQVRRLAAQAEQQASRRSAGDELAETVLALSQARWHAAGARIVAAERADATTRRALADAMGELEAREAAVGAVAAELAGRSAAEAERRVALDAATRARTEVRIRVGSIGSELAAIAREVERLGVERPALEAELARAAAIISRAPVETDPGLEADLDRAEAELAEAVGQPAGADRGVGAADDAVIRRLEAARRSEVDAARRRLGDAQRTAAAEATRAAGADALGVSARAEAAATAATVGAASADLAAARARRQALEREASELTAARATADRTAVADQSAIAATRGRLAAAEQTVAAVEGDAFVTAALARGGRRLDAEIVVEPDLRLAVRAALAGLGRAVVVSRSQVAGLARERGSAIVEEAVARPVGGSGHETADVDAFLTAVSARGGGRLADAIRRDDRGAARRLLARVAWIPELADGLALQAELPPGWLLVTRDGHGIVADVVVRLGASDEAADARAEVERLRTQLRAATAAAEATRSAASAAAATLTQRIAQLDEARLAEAAAAGAQRRAEEVARVAAARAEAAAREAAWLTAQSNRLAAEVERLHASLAELEPASAAEASAAEVGTAADRSGRGTPTSGPAPSTRNRVAALRATRDRLAALVGEGEARRRAAERELAAAEASIALGRSRLLTIEATAVEVAEREARLELERTQAEHELAAAVALEGEARLALDELIRQDAADRERLAEAERDAGRAREAVAAAQAAAQASERESLEARLGLEAIREQALVELAGLGPLGLHHLRLAAGLAEAIAPDEDVDEAQLAEALDAAARAWLANEPPDAPTPSRLGTLRRRFHELGAGNPFAQEEYGEVKARLDGLETQRSDLQGALDRTRTLIVELDQLITTQFRTTFASLERAFEGRFRQLFGGGYAKLSLTDPADLSATGVEIVARPPGKKPQPLAMLSGGERALTAVALLFAMLEVRPVPFCVLDEVDAALDEANIGRFTDALRELSARTQCIVITHNRGTIEVADALYGVTVGEDSVSRVISLRLEEAAGIAERVAAGAVAHQAAGTAIEAEPGIEAEPSQVAG
ncbi:MAG TPA: chromosome segregation protein SMC [Candidatus Limnocylindrales bacterium]|nr:chromosome segregation protein SMC [Candidatus Limnocylindrales bacterium]